MSWSLRFDEPIVLPDGAKLATLGEAIAHLGKVISDHEMPAVTRGGITDQGSRARRAVEFARIATLQALNRHNRKETHWGRRKLLTDE